MVNNSNILIYQSEDKELGKSEFLRKIGNSDFFKVLRKY